MKNKKIVWCLIGIIILGTIIIYISLKTGVFDKKNNETSLNGMQESVNVLDKRTDGAYLVEEFNAPIIFLENIKDLDIKEGEVYDINTGEKTTESTSRVSGYLMGITELEHDGKEAEGIRVVIRDGHWAYYDSMGYTLTEDLYDYAYNFSDGYAAVKKNGMWGYIDKTGKEVVGCQFEGTAPLSHGIALIKENGVWEKANIVDKDKRQLLYNRELVNDDLDSNVLWAMSPRLEYDDIIPNFGIDPFKELSQTYTTSDDVSAYITKNNGKFGVISSDFWEIVKPRYDEYRFAFFCTFLKINKDYTKEFSYMPYYGYENGHYYCDYSKSAGTYSEDDAHETNIKYGGYDDSQSEGSDSLYYWSRELNTTYEYSTYANCIHDEMDITDNKIPVLVQEANIDLKAQEGEQIKFKSGVYTGGKCGYASTSTKLLTELKYDVGREFNHECAAIKLNGKWGFIGLDGKEITDYIYDEVYDFTDSGYAAVCKNGKWGYIEKNGNEIVECVYDKTLPVGNKKAFIKKNGKWGVAEISQESVNKDSLKPEAEYNNEISDSEQLEPDIVGKDKLMENVLALLTGGESSRLGNFDFAKNGENNENIAKIYYNYSSNAPYTSNLDEFLNNYYPNSVKNIAEIDAKIEYISSHGSGGGPLELFKIFNVNKENGIITLEIERVSYMDEGDDILIDGYSSEYLENETNEEHSQRINKIVDKIHEDWYAGIIKPDGKSIIKFKINKDKRILIPIYLNNMERSGM